MTRPPTLVGGVGALLDVGSKEGVGAVDAFAAGGDALFGVGAADSVVLVAATRSGVPRLERIAKMPTAATATSRSAPAAIGATERFGTGATSMPLSTNA